MNFNVLQLGEVLYEERVYPPGKWACVRKADMLYEQSISNAFMKLMRFICKENSTGEHTHTHQHLQLSFSEGYSQKVQKIKINKVLTLEGPHETILGW